VAQKLTDGIVKKLPAPTTGNRIEYDTEVKGFGCRVTAKGARSFILNYRTRSGLERRYTIGSFPDWQTVAARQEAKEWKRRIDQGADPLEELKQLRGAPTVADLCERYEAEHLPKKRESSAASDRSIIRLHVLPALKHKKVADVTFSDVDALHRKLTVGGTPYRANRMVALLSKMFALAEKWAWIPKGSNPVKGIERNQEIKRHRYLSVDELERLIAALAEYPDQQAANMFRLLLLTGARSGEVRAARWEDFDLTTGVWTKPGSTTKQKTLHRVPLSAPARQLLSEILEARGDDGSPYIFPYNGSYRHELKREWAAICKAAGIEGARIHDLRHSYASILASSGLSLPVIGALLGHTQPSTTQRYAHLFDDPLRAATERVGAIVMGRPKGEVVSLKGGAA
jgi:integrase